MSAPASSAPIGAERPSVVFPIILKAFAVLLVTLAPLAIPLAAYVGLLPWPPIAGLSASLAGQTELFGASIQNQQLVFAGCALLSLLIGMLCFDLAFAKRISRLLTFVSEIRKGSFKRVPVLPQLGRDEIGEIARQIGYATLEFGNMREETDAANEQRTLFLMTAAHQLRTPLSELIWAIEDIRSARVTVEEREQLLVSVDGTMKRMRLIIEHLLSGAGVEEGKFGYVFEQKNVTALIAKIVEEFKPLSERQKVPVVFRAPESEIPVFIDEERLSLVIFDLISNAINYTPAGGNVIVSAAPAGNRMQVSVADTGIGMSEKERGLLFNKFYRSDRARHMHPDGSGLGLYLAKHILEKHGSDLLIESKEGKGTNMTFYLQSERSNVPH